MLYGIMLVYYDDFHKTAMDEFHRLLKQIDQESQLIAVSNNPKLDGDYIIGANENWEFSGWDKALATIKTLKDTDSVVFANDTFMYNNPYGKLKAFCIKEVFKYIYLKNQSKPNLFLAGSTCGLEQSYTICNLKADFWVSTYLFLLSGCLIKTLGNRISIEQNDLDELVKLDIENKRFNFDESISLNMQAHLQEWLYPQQDISSAWYKANEVSDAVKIKKVKTILNEKYISAVCQSNGGQIVDINPKKLFFRLFDKTYC